MDKSLVRELIGVFRFNLYKVFYLKNLKISWETSPQEGTTNNCQFTISGNRLIGELSQNPHEWHNHQRSSDSMIIRTVTTVEQNH